MSPSPKLGQIAPIVPNTADWRHGIWPEREKRYNRTRQISDMSGGIRRGSFLPISRTRAGHYRPIAGSMRRRLFQRDRETGATKSESNGAQELEAAFRSRGAVSLWRWDYDDAAHRDYTRSTSL